MTTLQHTPFRIALAADFYDEAGAPRYADFGLDTFEGHDRIVVSKFSEHRGEISPDQLTGNHAALVLSPKVTSDSLTGCEDLLAISRFGVGYDSVMSKPARRTMCWSRLLPEQSIGLSPKRRSAGCWLSHIACCRRTGWFAPAAGMTAASTWVATTLESPAS